MALWGNRKEGQDGNGPKTDLAMNWHASMAPSTGLKDHAILIPNVPSPINWWKRGVTDQYPGFSQINAYSFVKAGQKIGDYNGFTISAPTDGQFLGGGLHFEDEAWNKFARENAAQAPTEMSENNDIIFVFRPMLTAPDSINFADVLQHLTRDAGGADINDYLSGRKQIPNDENPEETRRELIETYGWMQSTALEKVAITDLPKYDPTIGNEYFASPSPDGGMGS